MSHNVLSLSRDVLSLSRDFPWRMGERVVCFSLCYYALLIWLLQWLLPFLKKLKEPGCSLDQGGSQCSDRRELRWGTPNKRSALGRWVRHRNLGLDPAAFQSLCAVQIRARGIGRSAAASLLHAAPSACALRAPVINDRGSVSLLPKRHCCATFSSSCVLVKGFGEQWNRKPT